MSTCFRCGKKLPDGQVECEYDCKPGADDGELSVHFQTFMDAMKAAAKRYHESGEIDWSRVRTHEDIIAVLQAALQCRVFHPDDYPRLRPYLKFPGQSKQESHEN